MGGRACSRRSCVIVAMRASSISIGSRLDFPFMAETRFGFYLVAEPIAARRAPPSAALCYLSGRRTDIGGLAALEDDGAGLLCTRHRVCRPMPCSDCVVRALFQDAHLARPSARRHGGARRSSESGEQAAVRRCRRQAARPAERPVTECRSRPCCFVVDNWFHVPIESPVSTAFNASSPCCAPKKESPTAINTSRSRRHGDRRQILLCCH